MLWGWKQHPHTIPTSFYRFHLYLKYWLPRGFFFGSLYACVLAKYASPFHIYSWLLVVVVVVNTHFFLTVNMLLNAILHTYITFQYLSIFDEPKNNEDFSFWNCKMKQKTLRQVFDQNINSEMLLWSGNDAIFGITICFHGRKMRIWLQLLQKPFAEKNSTILLKSIHIFCSHVGLYHSEKTDVWQGISYALRNFILHI